MRQKTEVCKCSAGLEKAFDAALESGVRIGGYECGECGRKFHIDKAKWDLLVKSRRPKPGPSYAETTELLAKAARKWALWDARYQAFMTDDLEAMGEHDRLDAKRHKWMARTLSYGHHLLSGQKMREE